MRLYIASGQPSAALRQFRQVAEVNGAPNGARTYATDAGVRAEGAA